MLVNVIEYPFLHFNFFISFLYKAFIYSFVVGVTWNIYDELNFYEGFYTASFMITRVGIVTSYSPFYYFLDYVTTGITKHFWFVFVAACFDI